MNSPSIYLLHGWGCDSSTWQPLLPFLQKHFKVTALDLPGFGDAAALPSFELNSVLDKLANQIEDQSILLGWSLGGNFALQMAEKFPQKVAHLITLGTNLKFVASHDYACAMPAETNQTFNRGFAENPIATLKLFGGLTAQGDNNERALLKELRQQMKLDAMNHNWLQALELLATIDNRDAYRRIKIPGLHLLADKDALVPVSCAEEFKRLNPSQSVEIIQDSSHSLHWSQPELVAKKIVQFLSQHLASKEIASETTVSKKRIAQSFGRAVATYDQAAELQRKVGHKLLTYLDSFEDVEVVLDLGCGTGHFLAPLKEKFSSARVLGGDLSEAMLHQIKNTQSLSANDFLPLVCCDAESLAFDNKSFDRIYSNFSLQWCFNLPQLFAELKRTLRLGGELAFTTLGSSSLNELKAAWREVDDQVHVNQFFSANEWHDQAQKYFPAVNISVETEVMYFPDFKTLAKSLKMLGAHNLNNGRPAGLTGRKKIEALQAAYEQFRTAQGLPITYEVIYCRAK